MGQQVASYSVTRYMAQGGMADVYLARDNDLKRDVVLKVLKPSLAENQEVVARFRREAQVMARLYHANIVPVYATGMMPAGLPYIVLQYIEGGSLSAHLQQLGQQNQWVSTVYALAVVRQIASALATAHTAGIIHRDIKPANILLRADGTPVLSDLGIAAMQQETARLTQTGVIMGTPNYMSPEQASSSKSVDGRADIYALGVILYELLSGRLPFEADSPWGMIHQHIYEQPAPLEQIRPGLMETTYRVVATCLQKAPTARYQTAEELVAALDTALAAEGANPTADAAPWQPPPTVATIDLPRSAPATTRRHKKPAYWWYGAGLLLVSLLLLGWWRATSQGSAVSTAEAITKPAPTFTITAAVVALVARPTSTLRPTQAASPTPVPTALPPTAVPSQSPVPATVPPITRTNDFVAGVLAYSCGPANNQQIYLSGVDGRVQSLLAGQPGNSLVPAFSRDGLEIAYRSNESGSWQIYVSGIDGSNRRQLTTGESNNYEAVWSPEDHQFAFASDRTGSRQIYIMNSDGSQQRRLTFNDAYNDDPSWSVDNRIIYESNEDGRFGIYQVFPEGGVPEALISLMDGSSTASWSWDGQRLAFEVSNGGELHLWLADRNGGLPERLTSTGTRNERPAWSPDGTHLAFASNYEQPDEMLFDIWVIDLTDRSLQRLTRRGDCFDPAWSPAAAPDACPVSAGMLVHAGENTRLWSQPDVLIGHRLGAVEAGHAFDIVGGPVWGHIQPAHWGWWWEVGDQSSEQYGWLWQSRLVECGTGP